MSDFREVKRRAVSFEQFAASKGVKLNRDALAAVIGMALLPHKTAAQRGKWHSAIQRYVAERELYERYLVEVPEETQLVPLDMSKSADQAYVRVMAKRAERRKVK